MITVTACTKDLSIEPGVAPHRVSEYAGIGIDKEDTPRAYPVKR